MTPKVFVSVGGASNPQQAEAAETIFRLLDRAGLSPRQMKKNEWSSEQPLRAIRRVIDECEGAVIIAFTRYQFPTGMERQKDGSEKILTNVCLPTVWNQIEAAMAYTKRLPLLVVAEHGLREDGLLEGRYDWNVFWTDFSREEIDSDTFTGFLETWKRLVDEAADARSGEDIPDLSKASVATLLGSLSVPQLWKVGSALIGLMIGIATVAYVAGSGTWPWQ